MVPEQLRRLIQQGESMDVELKGEAQRPLSDDDIVRAVVLCQLCYICDGLNTK
jgi:hypothetical protein